MLSPLALLERCALQKQAELRAGKKILGGCNGPHKHPEPPLRNAAQWVIIFSRLYLLTGNDAYRDDAKLAYNVLVENEALQAGRVPLLRHMDGNQANGVIGVAWLIEALIITSKILNCDWGYETANKLARCPGFDWKLGFWETCEPNGEIIGVDFTPNHQLWFAMALAMIPNKDQETADRLHRFINCYPRYFQLTPDHMIAHQAYRTGIKPLDRSTKIIEILRTSQINSVAQKIGWLHPKIQKINKFYKYVIEKEIGYHIFNMHAIARLKRYGVEFAGISEGISRAVETIFSPTYQSILENNPWGYPYNPPGFEVPIALNTFASADSRTIATSQYYYTKQLEKTYNPETACFDRNTPDANTLSARLYSLSLLDLNELEAMGRTSETIVNITENE